MEATLTSGELSVKVARTGPWHVDFLAGGRTLTSSGPKNMGIMRDASTGAHYLREQLNLGVGTAVYGLGERFGPLVKNGQVVDIWNADGGTATEQAYKNVPFYLTDAGYGVFVDHPGKVSFEVGSEAVSRVQFSAETTSRGGVFSGRVEHLSSGRRVRFGSSEELAATLVKLLDDIEDPASTP